MKFKIAKKHTSRFIINCGILLLAFSSFAQEKTTKEVTPVLTDSTAQSPHYYPQRYGIRVGVDLFRITRSFYDKTYQGFEVVGDYRLTKNWYAAAEIGHDKMTRNENSYGFTTTGSYIRLGGNYNFCLLYTSVNAVAHNDMAIIPYLKSPVGSELVRVEGTDEFEALD